MSRMVKFLLIVFVALSGYWYYEIQKPGTDVLTKFEVDLETRSQRPDKVFSTTRESDETKDNCVVWGPFSEKRAAEVLKRLKVVGLDSKTLLLDRFASDRFLVYLGPFEGKTAAFAFTKQFKQQGYRNTRAITSGELSFGVEIEEFMTEEDAKKYLISGKGPKVKGIRVVKRLGESTDEVDMTLRGLSQSEAETFEKIRKQFPSAHVGACPKP